MKRAIIVMCLFLTLIVACHHVNKFARQPFKISNEESLHGRVACINEYTYDAINSFGEMKEGKLINQLTKRYNQNGYLVEEISYYPIQDGFLGGKDVYRYDSSDLLINRTSYDAIGMSASNDSKEPFLFRLSNKINYVYDSTSNSVKGEIFDKNGLTGFELYKFNYNGRVISTQNFESMKRLYSFDTTCYNKKGLQETVFGIYLPNKDSKSIFDKNTSFHKETYKYDKNNNLIEVNRNYDKYGNALPLPKKDTNDQLYC